MRGELFDRARHNQHWLELLLGTEEMSASKVDEEM